MKWILLALTSFSISYALAYSYDDRERLFQIQYEIRHNSQFQDVSKELSLYKNLAHKAGINEDLVKKFVSDYQAKSAERAKQEEENCQTNYDYRNKLTPPRNQGGSYWCFAYASADLISYKIGKPVSATDIAIKYYDSNIDQFLKFLGKDETDFRGGYPVEALNKTLENGACLETNFKSDNTNQLAVTKQLMAIEKFKADSALSPITTKYCANTYNKSRAIFPNVKLQDFTNIMQKSSINYIEKMADKSCEPRINLSELKVSTVSGEEQNYDDQKKMFNTIDQQLKNKNIAMISYHASILNPNSTQYHSSTIVGRRYNQEKKQCEYLIRNSWGNSCLDYKSGIQCEGGNAWLPKSELAKVLYQVTYLQ